MADNVKKAPKRPAVSVRAETYEKLRVFAQAKGRQPSELLEELLQRFFVEQRIGRSN
jgi:hypothetical protein